ncbi:MAG: hypothetical protein LQ351_003262 [Letrouitia transgressa]|nr:MAG: hypothetical protein LQ351_003262 [Letrouitia transgressa]
MVSPKPQPPHTTSSTIRTINTSTFTMRFQLALIFVAAASFLPSAFAKTPPGIHCKGSIFCGSNKHRRILDELVEVVEKIPDDRTFTQHEFVACNWANMFDGGYCVFWEHKTGRTTAKETKDHLLELQAYGDCKICGAIPLGYPESNDRRKGQLTVNYVHNPCQVKSGAHVCE